jgi:hypothetical protein
LAQICTAVYVYDTLIRNSVLAYIDRFAPHRNDPFINKSNYMAANALCLSPTGIPKIEVIGQASNIMQRSLCSIGAMPLADTESPSTSSGRLVFG